MPSPMGQPAGAMPRPIQPSQTSGQPL